LACFRPRIALIDVRDRFLGRRDAFGQVFAQGVDPLGQLRLLIWRGGVAPFAEDGIHFAGHAAGRHATACKRDEALKGGVDRTRRAGGPCSHGDQLLKVRPRSMFLLCSGRGRAVQ
jgi:hypothetical protein